MAAPHAAYALVATYLRFLEARLEEAIHARQAKKAKQEAQKRAQGICEAGVAAGSGAWKLVAQR